MFDLSWELLIKWLNFFTTPHLSPNDHESALRIGLGVTKTFWQVGKFTNTYSMNNEGLLSILGFPGGLVVKNLPAKQETQV